MIRVDRLDEKISEKSFSNDLGQIENLQYFSEWFAKKERRSRQRGRYRDRSIGRQRGKETQTVGSGNEKNSDMWHIISRYKKPVPSSSLHLALNYN